MSRITSIDVAKRAGVSQSAESRTFAHGAAVSKCTSKKVLKEDLQTPSKWGCHFISNVFQQFSSNSRLFYTFLIDMTCQIDWQAPLKGFCPLTSLFRFTFDADIRPVIPA